MPERKAVPGARQAARAQEFPPRLPLITIASPSGFQPKVQSRLVGGGGLCAGSVEVRRGGQWAALCHSPSGTSRWEEVCQEQQCGPFNSFRVLDAGEKTPRGLLCPQDKLSQCHQLQEKSAYCKRVFVTCESARPRGRRAVLGLPCRTQSASTFLKNRPRELDREPRSPRKGGMASGGRRGARA